MNPTSGTQTHMANREFALAKQSELQEIMAIYRSIIGTPGCPWSEHYPTQELAETDIKNNNLYVLKEDNSIIAVASAGIFDDLEHLPWSVDNPCQLARIGVIPEIQGRGIGSVILRNVIDVVKERGYDGITILVAKANLAAQAMYDKNGFERRGETNMFDIDFHCYQLRF